MMRSPPKRAAKRQLDDDVRLARAGISCNVVAAYFHDHLFVPVEHADRALAVLEGLQLQAAPAT